MSQQIQIRRGTAAAWTSANPVLAQGEFGFEYDTTKVKLGDGTTHWTSLAYFTAGLTYTDVGADAAGAAAAVLATSLQKASNLSDVASASTARTNLGLGSAAVAAIDATSGDITVSAAGDSQAAGATGKVADAGHKHGREAFGSVTAQTSYGSSSGNGAAATLARSDHTHGTPALNSTAGTITWPGTQAAGSTGQAADAGHVHPAELGWYNVKHYGAVGNGSTDDTTAVQAAINATAATGGVVYFPRGVYKITAGLTYNSSGVYAVAFRGDNASGGTADGSVIAFTPGSTPYVAVKITNAYMSYMDHLTICGAFGSSMSQTGGWTGLEVDNSVFRMDNCQIGSFAISTGASAPTTGFACNVDAYITNSTICGQQFGLVQMGNSPGLVTENTLFMAAAGNGSACVKMDANGINNSSGSLLMSNSFTGGGDYGFQMTSQTPGVVYPVFATFNNVGLNNCAVAMMDFVYGGQIFGNGIWTTNNGGAAGTLTHGLHFHSTFQGGVYLVDTNIGAFSGHGLWIEGGFGYTITGLNIGDCGYSTTTNTYDDIHITSGVSRVTLSNINFDTDPWTGLNASPARLGLYIENGVTNYQVSNCTAVASGYATATCIDLNPNASHYRNNINIPNSGTVSYSSIPHLIGTAAVSTGATSGAVGTTSEAVPVGQAVNVMFIASASTTFTVSDSHSNTYTQISAQQLGSSGKYMYMFASPVTTAIPASTAITATSSTSTTWESAIYTVPLGTQCYLAGAAGGTGTSVSVTLSNLRPNSVLVSHFGNAGNVNITTWGPNWTNWSSTFGVNSLVDNFQYIQPKDLTSTTVTAAFAGSQSWSAVVVGFAVPVPDTVQTAAIDTVAGDIAALGTQAAGATGKLADAGHVHPIGTVSSQTTTYTVLATDRTVLADATSSAFTVTLPTAVGCTGRIYTVIKKDSAAHTVTVGTTSSQTINGSTTYTGLTAQYNRVTVQSDGSNWWILNT